jgi:hypothetical protein
MVVAAENRERTARPLVGSWMLQQIDVTGDGIVFALEGDFDARRDHAPLEKIESATGLDLTALRRIREGN